MYVIEETLGKIQVCIQALSAYLKIPYFSFMKKIYFSCVALLFSILTGAQNSDALKWSVQFETSKKCFVENKGQFTGRNNLPGTEILFAADDRNMQILFTTQGWTYRFDNWYRNPNRKKGDASKPKYLVKTELVHVWWDGANPAATILAEELTGSNNIYCMANEKRTAHYAIESVKGYRKLTYKNIYPNIDVEYTFHPQSGIKYSLVAHPGADISQIAMKYANRYNPSLDESGHLIVSTSFGDIIEHAPVTFYADGNKEAIPSGFIIRNDVVSFYVSSYDQTRKLIIDPWVQIPVLPNSNGVWECETDSVGNVYIIGGDMPMRLQKYNAAGVLQWTYNTPWDTTGTWLGTLATDLEGNSYITAGSNAAMQKISTSGSLQWSEQGQQSDEYWSIAFNCGQTEMMVGGTELNLINISFSHGVVFKINTSNGNVTDTALVSRTRPTSFFQDINEVRAITSSGNSQYYFLTLDTIGAINDDFNLSGGNNSFAINSTYNFGYKSEFFRPSNGNSGICAIRANENFVYTQNGTHVHKRSLTDGNILATATITGGIDTVIFMGFKMPGNSGIDIDACGNVYVGSADRVLKFDADLNVLDSVLLPFRVFDVEVSANGEVIVVGATGNTASVQRTGYLQSINMSSCSTLPLASCCNTSIGRTGPFYINDSIVPLSAATAGGTWSGTGITDSLAGTFDPALAGYGTHTVIYIIPCGSDSIFITVINPLEVCITSDTMLLVSNGVAPYAWQELDTITDCSNCFSGTCNVPIGCAQTILQWITVSTDSTFRIPDSFPIKITDNTGFERILYDTIGLVACPVYSEILVWPGDANDDLSANIFDFFPLIFNYGFAGNLRDSISNLWMGHSCQEWSQNVFLGINAAHADCNGDGIIDWNDLDAISLNYGLVHPRKQRGGDRAGEPPLFLFSDKNIYQPGDTVTIEIHVGDTNNIVDAIYGIAFRIGFDNSYVEAGTMEAVFPNSFLGGTSDNLWFDKISEVSGEADAAVGRKDQINANGHGAVAYLKFVAKNTTTFPINAALHVSDYLAFNATADSVFFDLQNSSVEFILDGVSGISAYSNKRVYFRAYPNPFDKTLTIEYKLPQSARTSFRIYDLLGKVVMEKPLESQSEGLHRIFFETSLAFNSVLFAELIVDGEKIRKKLVRIK